MTNVEQFFEDYPRAARTRDRALMVGLYAEAVRIFDLWDQFSVDGKQAWGALVDRWFGSLGAETVSVTFSEVVIRTEGEIALAHGSVHFAAVSPGGEVLRSMRNRITLGFERQQGQWLVVHQHTSLPIGSEDLRAQFS